MHEAEALCNRIAILDDGKIVALASSDGNPPTLEDVFMALTGKALRGEAEEVAEVEAGG
jgi:ABC-type multidrug transport system ATPase subunit